MRYAREADPTDCRDSTNAGDRPAPAGVSPRAASSEDGDGGRSMPSDGAAMKPFRPWRILGALAALAGSPAWSAEPPEDPPAVGTPAFPATSPPADTLRSTPRSTATSSEDG